jgi:uncharacterized protein (TIGR02145 family)
MSEQKYELTTESKTINGKTLYRIKALKSFANVEAGDTGGFVESERNLSQAGNAWVGGDACVFDNARVYGEARVYGDAQIYGDAEVFDNAKINDRAKIYGNAQVYDSAKIYDEAEVFGNAEVFDIARVFDVAKVSGKEQVSGTMQIFEEAKITGKEQISDTAQVCGETFTDPRDGRVYKIVRIGNQVWMAENLNYAAEGSKYYGNDSKNAVFGRLYDWKTAMNACPEGWHLPSNEEWDALINNVCGGYKAGKHLKAQYGWDNNGNGMDDYGFAALPGGLGKSDGSFSYVSSSGYWWSASEYNASNAYYVVMDYSHELVFSDDYDKTGLLSVRCVKD